MSTVIELKDLYKKYTLGETTVKALNGINLKINKGEFVTIFGPSGCGKSTLMHMIGLLDKPTSGEVLINNKETSKLSDDEKTMLRNESIGFVFQFFFLSPNLTAIENVEMPMIFKEESISKRRARAKELLKLVNLSERLNHLPYQLSGGQRQRVAIARALSNKPELILADEPTGNLDSATGKEVIKTFKELWKKGNTLVMVTHDQALAHEAPRTIYMLDGGIIKDVKNKN
ncbi:MAG: ABC transporter ATP-binding protein [Candidatus Nanoarchaeia archaeon]|jgi:putative ABC transport system ATP-binding protein